MGAKIHGPIGTDGVVEKPSTNPILNLGYCVSELFCYSLTLQRVYGIRLGWGRHDDERHHRNAQIGFQQSVIQACVGIKRQKVMKAEEHGRASDSMNMSTPLLRYSYRPAMNIWASEKIGE